MARAGRPEEIASAERACGLRIGARRKHHQKTNRAPIVGAMLLSCR